MKQTERPAITFPRDEIQTLKGQVKERDRLLSLRNVIIEKLAYEYDLARRPGSRTATQIIAEATDRWRMPR